MFRLKRQLKNMHQQATPSHAFKMHLWHKLAEELGEASDCVPVRRFRFATVTGIASLVLVFGMGTGVYAYESPSVVDGHPLHFMKEGIESVEGVFARSPEGRARFHTRMMSRRLEEGETHLQDAAHAQRALERAAIQFEYSVDEVAGGFKDLERRGSFFDDLSVQQARYVELSSRVLESEDEIGGPWSLQHRVETHELSSEELRRLFRMNHGAMIDEEQR